MMDQTDPVVDTHSLDGGSPSADSGVFSSSMDKLEIIQKDIGYSSDADMSDAIEVSLLLCQLRTGNCCSSAPAPLVTVTIAVIALFLVDCYTSTLLVPQTRKQQIHACSAHA